MIIVFKLGCEDGARQVGVTVFKGGEVNVRLDELTVAALEADMAAASDWFQLEKPSIVVNAFISDSNTLMAFMLTVDAIRRISPSVEITAVIPYFPYARQDRVCNKGEALSASVVAAMINSLNLESVVVLDPHSDVTPAVLNNVRIVKQADILKRLIEKHIRNYFVNFTNSGAIIQQPTTISPKELTIFAPDQGAYKKVIGIAKDLNFGGFGHAIKDRNPQTMEIERIQISGDVKGKNVLVVDDICDGGRTFVELAKQLRAEGVESLQLFVTHGIFSYGIETLLDHYDRIFTTNSFHGLNIPVNLVHPRVYWMHA